jgi:hypothetical protein
MKSPFRVSRSLNRCQRLVRRPQFFLLLFVALKFFLKLVHDAHLEVTLGREVNIFITLMKLLTALHKVTLHQIQKFVILLLVHSRILDDY